MARLPLRVVALLGALLGLSTAVRAASVPPDLRFRSVDTPRVTVHYHQGLEAMAREAATLATEILEGHERRYGYKVGRVQIVLTDVDEEPNGSASPLPYPLVHVKAVAPDGTSDLGNHDGWLRLVLVHELAHIVHLEEAGGVLAAGRKILGRVPIFFPNGATPTWMVEGLATYEETEATAFGRGRDPDGWMVMRMAALAGDLPGEDRAVRGLDRWPGGDAAYLYGEAFLRDLSRRFGEGTLPELARVHSRRPIPYADDLTSLKVTGATFHTRWQEWLVEVRRKAQAEVAARRARGLTPSTALTTRGNRQRSPAFSPDGGWVAYTNRSLSRHRAIHLVRADGTEDRRLVRRVGGATLSWSPDGRSIVYEELHPHRLFYTRADLRMVDVASRRVRWLTRGARARDPHVSRDGRIVFVRQRTGGGDLGLVGLDGSGLRDLTRSGAGEQWSGPRWSPRGDVIAASRWRPGGFLDIVLVDPATGTVTPLMEDRAKDVEPTWTPDGTHIVFRSDRDGASNLYAWRLADGALLRVTNVLGGAFEPEVSPDGGRIAFADYSARGYDLRLMSLDPARLAPAEPFVDPYPPSAPLPAPLPFPDRAYRPFPTMRPRFWTPFLRNRSRDLRLGAVTAGADPLLRHAYGVAAEYGTELKRVGVQGFYQYDRFRPTFLLTFSDQSSALEMGRYEREREVTLRASLPVRRTTRTGQSLSLAYRRSRDRIYDTAEPGPLDFGGIEVGWVFSSVRDYAYTISPVEGTRLSLSFLKEEPGLGSDVAVGKLIADVRAYHRVLGEEDAVALRVGGGTTFGRPSFTRSFAVGGFPASGLLNVIRTAHSVLRGYEDDAFAGRTFAHANLEYRVPLGHPQRGFRTFPLFVRHVHATAFVDAANAWTGGFRLRDVKTGIGAALGADLNLGHGLPFTGMVGLARGLADGGATQVYVRAGLAF